MPDFIKIDVEGYEDKVLEGLSKPVKALSFEFTLPYLEPALRGLGLAEALGLSWFNYIEQEVMRLKETNWISRRVITGILQRLPVSTFYGDIFAIQEAAMNDEPKEEIKNKGKKAKLPKLQLEDGMVIGAPGRGLAVIEGGKWRAVPDVPTQLAMGIGMHHVVMLHQEQFDSIPKGKAMPSILKKKRPS